MGQGQRFAHGGDGDLPVGLGLGAAHARGHQRRLGINHVLRQRQLLLEPGARQARALRGLRHGLVRHAQALVGGLQFEAGLLDFEIERQPQLALFLA